MTTDTPRTDELDYNQDLKSYRIWDLARQLERELAEAKADVERLKSGFQGSCYCCEPVGIMNQKLEAEVKRLKANLVRAIEIADVLRSGGSRACRELHHPKRDQHEYGEVCPVEERLEKAESELDQLKATLNPNKK